ncbi:hypothetical protein HOY80DRAFT_1005908 [Tuber brumale]|nr:hypothetical protein HOY80DRAFT_1005908 [Tuber brumale]
MAGVHTSGREVLVLVLALEYGTVLPRLYQEFTTPSPPPSPPFWLCLVPVLFNQQNPSHLPSFLLKKNNLNQSPNQYSSNRSGNPPTTTNPNNTPMGNHPAAGDDDEQSRILSQISPLKSWKMHSNVASTPVEDLGGWVLEISEFHEWQGDRSNAVLFCRGASKTGNTFIK